jgi:hypothetical protein
LAVLIDAGRKIAVEEAGGGHGEIARHADTGLREQAAQRRQGRDGTPASLQDSRGSHSSTHCPPFNRGGFFVACRSVPV